MVRRGNPDPLLLQTVSERLVRLLAEDEPRRVAGPSGALGDDLSAAGPPAAGPPAAGPTTSALPPPPVAPRDEEEGPGALPARRFGRAHLGVVVVVLLLGVLVAGWSLLRARPVALASAASGPGPVVVTEVPAPAGTASSGSSPTPSAGGPSPSPEPGLVVHVLGAVRRPGLVRLPASARVQDAVDAAGGFTRAADPGELNLAQLLTDGQQVVIGTRDDPDGEVRGSGGGPPAPGGAPGGGPGAGAVVDLNSADPTRLEELPGVGPVTAAKIVAWRDAHGRFSRVEDLQEVDGIGPKTYAEIAPHVRV